MKINPQIIKPINNDPLRLDKFLAEYLNVARTQITVLVQKHLILVNQVIANKPGIFIKAGDEIEILLDTNAVVKTCFTTPTQLNLDIVYEDSDLIIINKPASMLSLPTQHEEINTLLNGLIYYSKNVWTPLVVHRLDKDTSGLILFAKNEKAQQILLKDFEQRQVIKKYYALVHNQLNRNHLMIDVPIGRANDQSMKMVAGDAKLPKPAKTEVEVIKTWERFSFLDVTLHTGRTHQIRVHLKYINHPIVNDPLYSNMQLFNDDLQLLMAYYLEFDHPITKKKMIFKIELETRFLKLINLLDTNQI